MAIVSFSSSTYSIGESTGTLQITVVRSSVTNTMVLVLVTSDASAGTAAGKCLNFPHSISSMCAFYLAGEDYITVTELVEFQPGETEKNITVYILDDSRTERAETFELYLTGGTGVHLSPFFRAVVTIVDDDGIIILPFQECVQLVRIEPVY